MVKIRLTCSIYQDGGDTDTVPSGKATPALAGPYVESKHEFKADED